MSKDNFFRLFKRRGFVETIEMLNTFDNQEAIQATFFSKLSEVESYPNVFFRVKNDLLKHSLIAYKLNSSNEKVIYLTDKGKNVWNLIQDIEKLLVNKE
jgi:predicted transcriptional regulator